MGAKLSKDEKQYIKNFASDSYLLIKHEPFKGIDYYSVYDQNGNKHYSINVRGKYRKKGTESPTLEIYDDIGSVIGTIRWNNEFPSSSPFSVRCVDNIGSINKVYGEKKILFRKSWYQPTFSDWTLDGSTIFMGNGQKCADINTIENFTKNRRGVKKLRDSYLIDRDYDLESNLNDVMALLFWATIYIRDAYESIHTDRHPNYVEKSKLEKKIEKAIGNAEDALDARKETIEHKQNDAFEELHIRAKTYVNDKQARLQEKADAKSKKKRILLVIVKVLICLIAPVAGMFAIAIINQYASVNIDLNIGAAILLIMAILITNRNKPEWVILYEWLGLLLFCVIGLIVCSYLGTLIEHFLAIKGINGINIRFPLILLVVTGICKWKSRQIDKLVNARFMFSIIQFVSLGLLVGQICMKLIDGSGLFLSFIGIAVIVAVIVLSKTKILVRKNVRHCVIGVAAGVLLVSLVWPILKILLS